jgi:hypothetical protein
MVASGRQLLGTLDCFAEPRNRLVMKQEMIYISI